MSNNKVDIVSSDVAMFRRVTKSIVSIMQIGCVILSIFFAGSCFKLLLDIGKTECKDEQITFTALMNYLPAMSIPFKDYPLAHTVAGEDHDFCIGVLSHTHSSQSPEDINLQCSLMTPPEWHEVHIDEGVILTPRYIAFCLVSVVTLASLGFAAVLSVVVMVSHELSLRESDPSSTETLLSTRFQARGPHVKYGASAADESGRMPGTLRTFLQMRMLIWVLSFGILVLILVGGTLAWDNLSPVDALVSFFPVAAFVVTLLITWKYIPTDENEIQQRLTSHQLRVGDGCVEVLLLYSCAIQPLIFALVFVSQSMTISSAEVWSGGVSIFTLYATMYLSESCYGRLRTDVTTDSRLAQNIKMLAVALSTIVSVIQIIGVYFVIGVLSIPFGLMDFSVSRWSNGLLSSNIVFTVVFVLRWSLFPFRYPYNSGKKEYYTNLFTFVVFVGYYLYFGYVALLCSFLHEYGSSTSV